MQPLLLKKQPGGPIMATLVKTEGEVQQRKHGVFKIDRDDGGRWILFERRSTGLTLHQYEWRPIITVTRQSLASWQYNVYWHETNETLSRTSPNARQVLLDILDLQEMEFIQMLNGF